MVYVGGAALAAAGLTGLTLALAIRRRRQIVGSLQSHLS
jgi:MYXO-CTERM domain-containing protein